MTYLVTEDMTERIKPLFGRFLTPLKAGPCRMLEVGCYEGYTSVWLTDTFLDHPSSTITCIDSWEIVDEEIERRFDANRRRCLRKDQIIKVKGRSEDVLLTLKTKFDFAYIDGDHEARSCMTDWVLVKRLMVPNGLVCIDDYRQEWGNGERRWANIAIDAILDMWSDQIEILYMGYQVWLRIK